MDTARTPITPYPRGWFLVSRSEELKPRRTKTVHYFGQDIVLYRTADGQAHAVDPYCPHLGAHLGHGGKVDGTSIRCPFHGWTFDGVSGQCKYVPEATRTPKVSRRLAAVLATAVSSSASRFAVNAGNGPRSST